MGVHYKLFFVIGLCLVAYHGAHAELPSGTIAADAPFLYIILSFSGQYFIPYTTTKGIVVMKPVIAATGLREADVLFTVGPQFQGLNASGSSDSQISPEIGGWQLFIKMRAYQQAGVIMGRLKQALQNDDILKSIYKAGLQVATVELVWFGTTEPDAMASSDSSSASTWLNQTVQIGSLTWQRRRRRRALLKGEKGADLDAAVPPAGKQVAAMPLPPPIKRISSMPSPAPTPPGDVPEAAHTPTAADTEKSHAHGWWWWWGARSMSTQVPRLAKIKIKAAEGAQDTVEEVVSATAYRSAAGDTLTHKGEARGSVPSTPAVFADMV